MNKLLRKAPGCGHVHICVKQEEAHRSQADRQECKMIKAMMTEIGEDVQ